MITLLCKLDLFISVICFVLKFTFYSIKIATPALFRLVLSLYFKIVSKSNTLVNLFESSQRHTQSCRHLGLWDGHGKRHLLSLFWVWEIGHTIGLVQTGLLGQNCMAPGFLSENFWVSEGPISVVEIHHHHCVLIYI